MVVNNFYVCIIIYFKLASYITCEADNLIHYMVRVSTPFFYFNFYNMTIYMIATTTLTFSWPYLGLPNLVLGFVDKFSIIC